MSYQKIKSSLEGYVNLTEPGSAIEGYVVKIINNVSTKHGYVDYLIVEQRETKDLLSLVLTANLVLIDWDRLVGKCVLITYLGKKDCKKEGKQYKSYDVMVDVEDEDEELF